MDAARRYARQPLPADPALWRDCQLIALVTKSLAGQRVVQAAGRFHRHRPK